MKSISAVELGVSEESLVEDDAINDLEENDFPLSSSLIETNVTIDSENTIDEAVSDIPSSDSFIVTLKTKMGKKESDVKGCGLKFLSGKVKEHYADQSKQHSKLSVRLIGNQCIALAQYSY